MVRNCDVNTFCDYQFVSSSDEFLVPMNTDAEIVSRRQDSLGRARFAERIAERVIGASCDASIVFGLAGPWGSGKSSVLNMIEEHINEHHEDTWVVARLTPWAASDVVTLSGEFYNCIANAMPGAEPGKDAARKLRGMAPVSVAVGNV